MMRTHALLRLAARPACLRQHVAGRHTVFSRLQRNLHVLGIESSADDTCVALLNIKKLPSGEDAALLVADHKVSCPNSKHKGIHPVEAAASHKEHLPRILSLPFLDSIRPDLICVTRGPGMNGCLSVGVSAAQALSSKWKVPIVGVHHMQAHALTPLMEMALRSWREGDNRGLLIDQRSMLTLLVSGKHTMLVHTKSEVNHRILASIQSIALGDVLDKIARLLVPPELIPSGNTAVCYPEIMQSLVESKLGTYVPPSRRATEERKIYQSEYGWSLSSPLRDTREMKYDFTGLNGSVLTILRERPHMPMAEREDLAYHTFRIAFEHLISRVVIALQTDKDLLRDPPKTLVMAGGVASNGFLAVLARRMLDKRGYPDVKCVSPKKRWCTDNAPMVAFAGYKMWDAGWQTDESFVPAPQWSLEEILTGVDGWVRRPGFPPIAPEDAQFTKYVQSVEDEHDVEGTVYDFEDTHAISSGETATRAPLNSVDGIDLAIAQLLRDTSLYVQEHEAISYGKSEFKDASGSATGNAREYTYEETPTAPEAALSRQTENSTMDPFPHRPAVKGLQVQQLQSPEESDIVDVFDQPSTPSEAHLTLSTVEGMRSKERRNFLAYWDNPRTVKITADERVRFHKLLGGEGAPSHRRVEVALSTMSTGYKPTSPSRRPKTLLWEDHASQDNYAGEGSTDKPLRPEPAAEEPPLSAGLISVEDSVEPTLDPAAGTAAQAPPLISRLRPTPKPQQTTSAPGSSIRSPEEPKPRMDNLPPPDHEVWSILSTATEKSTIKVRFVGSEGNPAMAKSGSLKGRIATVFGGWLGRK